MELYTKIKKNHCFEKYLDVLDKEKRISISRIRLSSHNFPIERMRYKKIKREQRICPICNLDEIGDEMHYLLRCKNTNIENTRNNFIDKIKKLQPQFVNFENNNIIQYCITMIDNLTYKTFSIFINDIFIVFKQEEEKVHNGTLV